MHPTTSLRRRIAAGMLTLAGLARGAAAQPLDAPAPAPPAPPAAAPAGLPAAAPAEVRVDPKTGALIVPLGGVARFRPTNPRPIREIVVRNEDVVNVRVDPTNIESLVFVGKKVGASRVVLTVGGRDGETRVAYDVVVQPDYELLRNVIRRTVPTATVDIIPGAGNAIIVTGFVTRAEDADTVIKIASDAVGGTVQNIINALQIGGSQHVLIDLTVAEVNRTLLRQRGFSFGVNGSNFGVSSVLGGLATSSVATNLFGGRGGDLRPGHPGGEHRVRDRPGELRRGAPGPADREPGQVPDRAEDHHPDRAAGVLPGRRAAGDHRPGVRDQRPRGPAPAVRDRAGGPPDRVREREDLPGSEPADHRGELRAGDHHLERDHPGVHRAAGPGVGDDGDRRDVRPRRAARELGPGDAAKVPYLGELPVVSWAFSNVTYQETETELLIMVTPRLVEPMDCAQVPRRLPGKETRGPDDYELFLESLLEAPRGQRKVWNGVCYNAAYKCSPTVNTFPASAGSAPARAGRRGRAAGMAGGTSAPPPEMSVVVPPASAVPAALPAAYAGLRPAPANTAAAPMAPPTVTPVGRRPRPGPGGPDRGPAGGGDRPHLGATPKSPNSRRRSSRRTGRPTRRSSRRPGRRPARRLPPRRGRGGLRR